MKKFYGDKRKKRHVFFSPTRILFIMGLMFFITSEVLAQNVIVKGKVTDAQTKKALPFVNVVVKGTNIGAVTNTKGEFSISAPANGTLVFSFVGYSRLDIPIKGRKQINVKMTPTSTQLKEVVVSVGYGTMKKRDITGSVASVTAQDLKNIPVTNISQALTGQMAGVHVLSTQGGPGASVQITVRGGNSITQSNSPLYIVNGFPVSDISDIAPSDIQSISVLKDAASTAIYGSRGANGVIIITTKTATAGKVSVSFNTYGGFKRIEKTLSVLKPADYVKWQYEFALLNNQGNSNDVINPQSYTRYFGLYQDMDLYNNQPGNNWQKQMFGRIGNVLNQNLNIRGGSKKISYAFNYARESEKAIVVGSNYKRNDLSLRLVHNPIKNIQLTYNFRYSNSIINGPGLTSETATSNSDSRLKHAVRYTPIPIEGLTSGSIEKSVSSYLINPLVSLSDNQEQQFKRDYNMNASFAWKITKNLRFKSEYGVEDYQYKKNRFYGTSTYYVSNYPPADLQGDPAVILERNNEENNTLINTLNYNFKDLLPQGNSLTLLLGQEYRLKKEKDLTAVIQGFPKQFNAGEAFKLTSQGIPYSTNNYFSPDKKLLSYFGRVDYNYQGTYYFTGSFRADGSSKFAPQNRWGYFPAASAAWRISDMGFMENTKGWLDNLKLRLSYGVAGNNNIPSGQIIQTFVSSTTAWIDGVSNYWAPSDVLANPDLTWETTYTRDAGIDFSLFNNKLSGTVDIYLNTTKNLLLKEPIPGTGYQYQYQNLGKTQNKGLEVSLNYKAVAKKNFTLGLNFNISFNRNKILSLGSLSAFGAASGWASTAIGNDYWIAPGGQIGLMYGYVSLGRYTINDFSGYDASTGKWILKPGEPDDSPIVGTVAPGVMKLKNVNGSSDNLVNHEDKTIIGNANPKCTGGFTINSRIYNFDVSAIFYFSYGNDVYNANKIEYSTATQKNEYLNLTSNMADGKRWTNLNPATGELTYDPTVLAQLNAHTTMWSPYMRNDVFSSWAVENGSFLRLSNLTVGYTFPLLLNKKLHISRLRVYVTGSNLWLWTKYSGFDPEVSTRRRTPLTPGVDYSAYPRSKQVIFGLNLNF